MGICDICGYGGEYDNSCCAEAIKHYRATITDLKGDLDRARATSVECARQRDQALADAKEWEEVAMDTGKELSEALTHLQAATAVADAARRVMGVTSMKGNPERALHEALTAYDSHQKRGWGGGQ